jgi:hypothetical protein
MLAVNCKAGCVSDSSLCPWPIPHLALSPHFRVTWRLIDLSPRTSAVGSETRVKTSQGHRSESPKLFGSSASLLSARQLADDPNGVHERFARLPGTPLRYAVTGTALGATNT